MIRIAISQAAFEAIARTLLLGTVSFENKTNQHGERLIWLEPGVVDRLRALRGRGERPLDEGKRPMTSAAVLVESRVRQDAIDQARMAHEPPPPLVYPGPELALPPRSDGVERQKIGRQ